MGTMTVRPRRLIALLCAAALTAGAWVGSAPPRAAHGAVTESRVSPNAPAQLLTFTAQGDVHRVAFQGLVDQVVTITASGGTFGSNCDAVLGLRDPAGNAVGSSTCAGRSGTLGPVTLAAAGMLRVDVEAAVGTGSVSLAVTSTTAKRSVTPHAAGVPVTIAPGATLNFGFSARAGQLIGAATDAAGCRATLAIIRPNGTALVPAQCAANMTTPTPAPVDGVYRARLRNTGSQPIALRLDAFVAAPLDTTITPDGTFLSVTLAPGESADIGFPAQAGRFITVTSDVVLCNGGLGIIAPDGQPLTGLPCHARVVPATAPLSGMYRARLTNTAPVAVTQAIRVFTGKHQERSGAVDAPAESFTLLPGQRFTLSFAGTDGQSIGVLYPGQFSRCVDLLRPDGSMVRHACGFQESTRMPNTKLDATGTWRLVFENRIEIALSSSLRVVTVPDPTPIVMDGAMKPVAFSGAGELSRVEFDATAGQRLVVTIFPRFLLCPSPASCTTEFELVAPDGTIAPSDRFGAVGLAQPVHHRRTVSQTGRWTLRAISPAAGFFFMAVADAPDLTTFVALDTPVDAASARLGQRWVISFPVVAGGRYGMVAPFDSSAPAVEFVQPDGTPAGGGLLEEQYGNPIRDRFVGPFTATSTGTAKVLITSGDGLAYASQVTLVQVGSLTPVTTSVQLGTASPVLDTGPVQTSRFLFSGVEGQRISVMASSFTYPGAVAVRLRLGNDRFLPSAAISAASPFVNPVRLPASGIWMAEVDAPLGDTGGLALRLANVVDIVRPVTVDGAGRSFTLTEPGQRAVIAFSRSAGTRFRVSVSNSTLGTQPITFLGPGGTLLQTSTVSGTSKTFNLLTAQTGGTYQVVIDPTGTGIGGATVSVTSA